MDTIDPISQHLLLEGIFLKYGYDFRQYAEASLHRRLESAMIKLSITEPMDLLKMVLKSKEVFYDVLKLLTVNTTELFRDPEFFRALREKVFPVLQTYPHVNIWVAGCSTGEEVYTLAIMLEEEGLRNKTNIYATDINSAVLKIAKEGIYPSEVLKVFAKNYASYGGKKGPSSYYTADYGLGRFDPGLRENVTFSEHNLVTDSVFTEAHLILCRNVVIYFNKQLQDRVTQLFYQSLSPRGFLGIGSKESLQFSSVYPGFEPVSLEQKIYRKNLKPLEITGGAT